jgi:hypothetical protein
VHLKGWVLLIVIFTMEIAGLLSRRKITIGKAEIDHLGHLGGFCTGVVSGWWCRTNQAEEKARQRKELAWYEKLIGKKARSPIPSLTASGCNCRAENYFLDARATSRLISNVAPLNGHLTPLFPTPSI